MSSATSRRPPPVNSELYSPARLISALKQSKGTIAVAARLVGCSRQTIYSAMKRHPEIQETLGDERELMLDTAELKLINAVVKGEPWAIQCFLKTQRKGRGYVEKKDVGLVPGKTLEELVLESVRINESLRTTSDVAARSHSNGPGGVRGSSD